MMQSLSKLTNIRSKLTDEVLCYLHDAAQRVAEVPSYYPAHLRSIEHGTTQFDEIRQTVQVVENRDAFQRWLARERYRLITAGQKELLAYGARAMRPDTLQCSSGDGEQEEDAPAPVPIPWDEHAGRRFRRAVILGDPGLGKTWLLRYETRCVARKSASLLESRLASLDDIEIPIYARLSDLNRRDETIEDAVIRLAASGHSEDFRTYVRRKLECESVALLLDAWDEVAERAELQQGLGQFARKRNNLRILITSRIVGYDVAPLPEADELELLALSKAEIEGFVRVWFGNNTELTRNFAAALDQNFGMAGLAETPLMLAMMCRLYTGEELPFPQRRVDLYERCLLGLLRDWKQTKGKQPDDVIVKSVEARLSQAAERLFLAQREQFTEAELAVALGYRIEVEVDANRAQKFINQRKLEGIFTAVNSNATELLFLHRTFLEFLVAKALAQKPWEIIGPLIDRHSSLPSWNGVIVLLAGQMSDPGQLLDMLADEKQDDFFRHRLALAVECLPEIEHEKHDLRVDQITVAAFSYWREHYYNDSETAIPHIQRTLPILATLDALIQPGRRFREEVCKLLQARSLEALYILQYLGPLGAKGKIVDELVSIVHSERDDYVRLELLAGMGPAAARPDIIDALIRPPEDPRFQLMLPHDARAAFRASSRIADLETLFLMVRRISELLQIAVPTFGSSDPRSHKLRHDIMACVLAWLKADRVGLFALDILREIGPALADYDAVIQLLNWIRDDPQDWHAHHALGAVGMGSARNRVLDQYLIMLRDGLSGLRLVAMSTLEELGTVAARADIIEQLCGLLEDSDKMVRDSAASSPCLNRPILG